MSEFLSASCILSRSLPVNWSSSNWTFQKSNERILFHENLECSPPSWNDCTSPAISQTLLLTHSSILEWKTAHCKHIFNEPTKNYHRENLSEIQQQATVINKKLSMCSRGSLPMLNVIIIYFRYSSERGKKLPRMFHKASYRFISLICCFVWRY